MTTLDSRTTTTSRLRQIDARGPRFAAAITVVVLAATLLTIDSTLSVVLLSIQTIAFALGSLIGLQAQPYGILFRTLVRPRLAPPTKLEDVAPARFAQTVGLAFAVVGLIGLLTGVTVVAYVAVGFALAAAFLNAVFDYCLGCEMYLLGKRVLGSRVAA